MGWTKVVEWVDIDAPQAAVFDLVLDVKRRVQLSPLWGTIEVDHISPDFPREGSYFHTRLVSSEAVGYDTVVTGYREGSHLSYHVNAEDSARVTWSVQKCARGTRLIYEEEFLASDGLEGEIRQPVQEAVKKWLNNLQRYSELHKTRFQRFVRWFLDRHFVKLKQEQRNVVTALLFMKVVSLITFIMAAIAYGIAILV